MLEESRLRRLAWATCLEEVGCWAFLGGLSQEKGKGSLARGVGLLKKWVYGPAGGREEEWAVETGRWVTDYCGPGPSGGAVGCSLVCCCLLLFIIIFIYLLRVVFVQP